MPVMHVSRLDTDLHENVLLKQEATTYLLKLTEGHRLLLYLLSALIRIEMASSFIFSNCLFIHPNPNVYPNTADGLSMAPA